jgi:DNA end-binding protein Ku
LTKALRFEGKQVSTSMAATRPYWKGYLRLSLVTTPILVYPAAGETEKIHFHQINRKTGHRLRQQMVDERTGKVVDKDEKGRGYELSKGKYVEIEPEDLKAIQVEATHTIDIDKFVPEEEIDRRYYEKPYYIVPDGKTGVDAFAVIRDAMKDKQRVALARIVMANREHIIALEPFEKGFLGTTLRYDYEVRDAKRYLSGIPSPRIDKEMVDLASHILDSKAGHFDPSKFKDEYEAALKKLVKRKAAGHTIEAAPEPERPSNVVNLMDALRQSIGGKGGQHARPHPRKPPGTHAKTGAKRKRANGRRRRAA